MFQRWLETVLIAACACGSARAQVTTRESISSLGVEGNFLSATPSISNDGRFVAFASFASNLVPGDTNGFEDIFVRDRLTGAVARASVSTAGVQGNAHCVGPSISGDGRLVVFASAANNLVAGDTNGFVDIFVHDNQSGTTTRVDVDSAGVQSNGQSLTDPAISGDGRYVTFASRASNLVPGDTNGRADIFVRDLQTSTTTRVSVDSAGGQGEFDSFTPSLSADGRYVVFHGRSTVFVPGDTNMSDDVFVHDRQTAVTTRVSVNSAGVEGDADSNVAGISANGRYIVFGSFSTNFAPPDNNWSYDVFVQDRQTGVTDCVSYTPAGSQGNQDSGIDVSISNDGRYVVFWSEATDLVPNDTNNGGDFFLRDRQAGTTVRVSVDSAGQQGNFGCDYYQTMSPDGRFITFASDAINLVSGDNNMVADIFVHTILPPVAGTPFCFGDGTGTVCPCANNGSAGNGCANSITAAGGNLQGHGITSVAADTFVLDATGLPNSYGLYFQGTAQVNGGSGFVFGDGLRCVGGSIQRLGTALATGNASHVPGTGGTSLSVLGVVSAGSVRHYQLWYRNAAPAFCSPSLFNLTNGVTVTWSP